MMLCLYRDLPRKSSLYDNVQGMRKIPEIVRLNYTTGNYSMFAENSV